MGELHSVICERRTFSDKPQAHEHSYAQLILPVSGSLSIAMGVSEMAHIQNEVIYIPPLCNHSYYSLNLNQFLVFDIPKTFFPCSKAEFKTTYFWDKRWEAIRTLVSGELGEGKQASSQRIADLFRYITGLLEKPGSFASLEYIHQHYHTRITIRDLASIEHYNESYFCEWFQRHVGQTPMDYVRQLRLDKAKRMLETSEYSVMQIAQEVGYENQATLNRLFSKYVGMSPLQYRKINR